MSHLNAPGVGLALGAFVALIHAIWSALVALKIAQPLLDWVLQLHHLSVPYTITPFVFGEAALLVLVSFAVAFLVGWVFAHLWNSLQE